MADLKQFLDYSGLQTYHGKNTECINTATDAAKADAIEASKITLDTTATTEGYAKSYNVKQNGISIGVIDIPKDMVVSDAKVVENPADKPAGTYIELTIANNDGTKIYIDVSKLVDNYVVATEATQVQLAIDTATRTISATLVNGGVSTDAIAAGAVTKAKLGVDVTAILDKAESAVQKVSEGNINGAIDVDGTKVSVHGLGDAAYADTTDFDAAGTAETKVKALEDGAVKTNADAIASLKSKVEGLEGVTIEAIPTAQITALFSADDEA